jgi:hypothetical protein
MRKIRVRLESDHPSPRSTKVYIQLVDEEKGEATEWEEVSGVYEAIWECSAETHAYATLRMRCEKADLVGDLAALFHEPPGGSGGTWLDKEYPSVTIEESAP